MTDSSDSKKSLSQAAVPKGRFARLSRFGALATSVAGGMVAEGARQLASGKRPKMSSLLLTPSNARRVAEQLSRLRGAAMKVGQLLSMDAGDLLPPELAEILAKLRSDARAMPTAQLQQVMRTAWGEDWQSRVKYFDERPVAAASIGQVHQAVTHDGRRLAVKIQYPGVADSIDSDIDNVASLFKMLGVVPKDVDLKPILEQAKAQLHEEADYVREAQLLQEFAQALDGRPGFVVPGVDADLCTGQVLAMDFVTGLPIESFVDADQDVRDRLASRMFELLFEEMYAMQVMQTDPNFANFLYREETNELVLLDFGATRHIPPLLSREYAKFADVGVNGQMQDLKQVGLDIGYFNTRVADKHLQPILNLMWLSCEPLRAGVYHFGATDLVQRIREYSMDLGRDLDFWHAPPIDCIFIHRKVAGTFMLACRLKARVDVGGLIQESIGRMPQA